MSSKYFFRSLAGLGLLLLIVGCSDFINGEKSKPEVLEFSDNRFQCLQLLPSQLKSFSIGEASKAEIEGGFDCVSNALIYFNRKTFGSAENAYTVEELRRFFGKYFLKQNNVTPEFAAELMKVKRALVGGNVELLRKDEIEGLVQILGAAKKEAVSLAPHVRILLHKTDLSQTDWDQISLAVEQLRRSAKKILEKTQVSKSEYSFDDAKNVFAGFADFIQGGENFAPYQDFSHWVPLVEAVKNILVGRKAHFAGLSQWNEALDSFVDVYELLLKYQARLAEAHIENPQKLRQFSQFFAKALSILNNSHQMKTSGFIPYQDIDHLIEEVLARSSTGLKVASVKKLYRTVLIKMLDPQRKLDTRGFVGLELKHLGTLQREFKVWRLTQSFIDMALSEQKAAKIELTQSQLLQLYNKFDKKFVIEKGLSDDAFEQQALLKSWEDFGSLLKAPRPVIFSEQGQMLVFDSKNQPSQTWFSQTQVNLMRALSRFLMMGYGESLDGSFLTNHLSKEGLVSWYADFKEFFLDLGSFDPRSDNSGARSFQEANFFTFSGNGDSVMDAGETFEFVSTLFAAGLGTSKKLQAGLTARCGVAEKDLFQNAFLSQDCFKKELKSQFGVYFSNMPGMVNYVKSLDDKKWEEFFSYILATSSTEDQRLGLIDTGNIRTMTTVLHYIENLMLVYDTDFNQTLSLTEIYTAAPRFMAFLRSVKPGTSDSILTEGFAYLVFKGAIPGATDLLAFQLSKSSLGEASRMNILRIFGALKDQLNKPKN